MSRPALRNALRCLREPSLVLWLYSVVALLVTYPLVTGLGRRLLGSARSDLWFHVWGYWWMKESLLSHHRFPVRTDHVNYPEGGILFLIDPLGSLLSVPLQLLFGLTAAYNLVALLNLVFAAAAAYYLIRYLLRRGEDSPDSAPLICLPALVGGLVFGFSPHLLGEIENGITETFHAGWIALYALLLLKTFDSRRLLLAVGMGLVLFLTFFANAYYGIFCLVLSVLVLAHRLITDRVGVLTRRFALALTLSVACFCAPAVPYYLAFSAAHDSPEALVHRNPAAPALHVLVRNKAFTTEATSLFVATDRGDDRSRSEGDHFNNISYLGYVPLILFLLGAVLAPATRPRYLWIAAFVVFSTLSLGPVLMLDGQVTTLGEDSYLTLPFYHLFTQIPYLCLVAHPYRLTVMSMLALAVMAGYALDHLWRRFTGWPLRAAVAALVAGGLLVETTSASPLVHPMSLTDGHVPSYYKDAQGEGALLNVPMTFCGTNQRRVYYYYQTRHRRRLPFVIEKTITPFLINNGFTAHLYYLEWMSDKDQHQPYHGYETPPADLDARVRQGLQQLRRLEFHSVVLDRRMFLPSQSQGYAPIKQYLDRHLGEPKQYEQQINVYTIR